ncbi:MAG TPA: hypothetical protein DD723_09085 [Candidatus Omnitrophica bacterium]|nr:hypothetical protein [Candidatus Omnitrophota bacterium]
MIDVIKQQFEDGMPMGKKLNLTREFLQILSLKILYEKGLFRNLAFVGGTALRILYDIKRFSEDLDFSLIDAKKYNFESLQSDLSKVFHLYGLPLEIKAQSARNVHSMMMKFTGLLKSLGLSELHGQKFSIKLEIDTNPPEGWEVTNTIVHKNYMFNILHYDLPSLFAGKLHACFYRKYTKGRDYYDLVWYLAKKVKPNFTLLNNAIKQTQGRESEINEENIKDFILSHIQQVDFEFVKKDVERFLEDKKELNLFDPRLIRETVNQLY